MIAKLAWIADLVMAASLFCLELSYSNAYVMQKSTGRRLAPLDHYQW